MWTIVGLVLALAIAAIAWRRSAVQSRAQGAGGFYDSGVYAMTPAAHRRYSLVSLAFAAYFALVFVLHATAAGLAGLTLYALIAVFYAASFLQGAADADQ